MADASAIRAGKGYVELGLDKSLLVTGLRDAGKTITDWGKKIATTGAVFTGLGAAIVTPLTLAAKTFVSLGSALQEMSTRTGLSAETLSKLQFAAKRTGTDLATVESGLGNMDSFLQKVAGGSAESTAQLNALGISLTNLNGTSSAEQLELIGRRITQIQDPVQRAKAAIAIFGASGTQLLPLLGNLAALNQQAEQLGLVMSTEDAAAAKELGNSWSTLGYTMNFLKSTIGAAVAGPLKEWTDYTINVVGSVTKWTRENRGLVTTLFRIGTTLATIGAVLVTVGGGMAAIGAILGGISSGIVSAAGAAGVALAFLLSPLGLLTAGLTIAGGAWLYYSGLAGKAVSGLKGSLGTLARDASLAYQNISNAFARGDLQGAIGEAWKFIKLEFSNGIQIVKSAWNEFSAAVATTAAGLGIRIKAAFQEFAASPWGQYFQGIAERAGPVFQFLSEGFSTLAKDAGTAFGGIKAALGQGDITAAAKILWLGLQLEWARGTNLLSRLWADFKLKFTTIAAEAFYGAVELFNNAWAGIKTAWVSTVAFFKDTWFGFSDAILEEWDAIVAKVRTKMLQLKALNPFANKQELVSEGIAIAAEVVNNKRDRAKAKKARGSGAGSATDDIEQERLAANASLPARQAEALAAARAAHDQAIAHPGADVEKARKAFEDAVAAAIAAARNAPAGKDAGKQFGIPTTADLKKTASGPETTGAFNALAIRGLGGNIADRIARATEATAKQTKKIADKSGPNFS